MRKGLRIRFLRTFYFSLLLLCILGTPEWVSSQKSGSPDDEVEAEIRRLDLEAARAIQQKDEKAIARYFTENSVTNNPRNGLTLGSKGVIEAARTNLIDYSSFDRIIESVQVLGNTAVVMGSETVVFRNTAFQAGATIRRRYTNVWMKTGKNWQIVARHANIICG